MTKGAVKIEREVDAFLAASAPDPTRRPLATTSSSRCAVCGVHKSGSTNFCRTHKFAIRRAARRVRDEALVVDQVGGAWWIWDVMGNVIVPGEDSKMRALAALDLGEVDPSETEA